ncbi:MAG TPA: hypothetical protein VFB61_06355 [Gemmatimonadales bacterium]|nr:hypothetical protein [Gemmatimonadales bacterium]
MRSTRVIPIAVLVLAAACSDTATSPTSVGGPLFAVTEGTFNDAVADASSTGLRSGGSVGHLQSGTINCIVNSALVVTCSGAGSYQLNGVGNKNATASLVANWSAQVDCTNNGGQLVEVKSTVQGAPATTGSLSPDNGHLTVPQLSTGVPPEAQLLAAARCPNKNWTKSLADGDPTLESFTYTLRFQGFSASNPAILIAAS